MKKPGHEQMKMHACAYAGRHTRRQACTPALVRKAGHKQVKIHTHTHAAHAHTHLESGKCGRENGVMGRAAGFGWKLRQIGV